MTHNDSQKAMLVHFAVREVGPRGSLEEMKAVCYCIRNRVRAGWHDGEWMATLEFADEHAAHAGGERVRIDANYRPYQMLLQAVDDIYYAQDYRPEGERDAIGETLESAVGTAKYWMFLNRPVRDWFQENVIDDKENHRQRGNMGLMMFFT